MARTLADWVATEVQPLKDKPLSWLSQYHFFRDPCRPTYSDDSYFLSPADGVILYQTVVDPDEPILDIKGKPYSVRTALRDETFSHRSLVIGIFMTFFDVHVNRLPYAGRLSFRELEPLESLNYPMLEAERSLLEDLRLPTAPPEYIHYNQRMTNRVWNATLEHPYYVLQIADYDIDCVMPFHLQQNRPMLQGQRFSQIRYGSQVELVIPLAESYDLVPTQEIGLHVEAGTDTLVEIVRRRGQEGDRDA